MGPTWRRRDQRGGVLLLRPAHVSGWTPGRGSDKVARPAAGVAVGRIRAAGLLRGGGRRGEVGALIALQTCTQPTTVVRIQYKRGHDVMVLIGGWATIEGPVLGAWCCSAEERCLPNVAWYLVMWWTGRSRDPVSTARLWDSGGVATGSVVPAPVGYRVSHAARMTADRPDRG